MNDEVSESAPVRAVAEVGARLRSARSKAGLTRKQLATASGASERYLAHLEAGTGNPSVEMLIAIAGALHVAMADLLPQGGAARSVHLLRTSCAACRVVD